MEYIKSKQNSLLTDAAVILQCEINCLEWIELCHAQRHSNNIIRQPPKDILRCRVCLKNDICMELEKLLGYCMVCVGLLRRNLRGVSKLAMNIWSDILGTDATFVIL